MTEKAKIILGKVSLTPKGEWMESTAYERLDVVSKDGNSYISLSNNNAYVVTDTTKWVLLAEKGDPGAKGEAGAQGEQGPAGPSGKGLTVSGYYSTLEELQTNVTNPSIGDAYGIGSSEPYDIYIYDSTSSQWVNNGPLQGAKGDSLKFSDLTEDEIKELQQPAIDAAATVTTVITNAETATTNANTAAQNAQNVADNLQSKLDNGDFKGEKGDAFTYDDFTEQQIVALQKPATDAAEVANAATSKADTATNAANVAATNANNAATIAKNLPKIQDGTWWTYDITSSTYTNTGVSATVDLPIATSNTLGGVKVGNNILVTSDGTISVDLSNYALKTDNTISEAPIDDSLYARSKGAWQSFTIPSLDGYATTDYVDSAIKSNEESVYHLNFSIFSLSSTSTSDEISTAVGGVTGFNAIVNAINKYVFCSHNDGVSFPVIVMYSSNTLSFNTKSENYDVQITITNNSGTFTAEQTMTAYTGEAPSDGNLYVRKDNGWQSITLLSTTEVQSMIDASIKTTINGDY